MIHIELVGSTKAVCADPYSLSNTSNVKDPLPGLCRQLIEAGVDPEEPVGVYRGTTLCFKPKPVSYWAGVSITEHETRGIQINPYQPLDSEVYKKAS